jgi:hydroxyacylglutathione hydrolase
MITLEQLPALVDNTIWAIAIDPSIDGAGGGDDDDRRGFVVDPGEAAPVLGWLARTGRRLDAVVCTHHHADHIGGVLELQRATGCRVVGAAHDQDRLPTLSDPVRPGDVVTVAGVSLRVLDTAAHTRGHVAYALDAEVDVVLRHGHQGEARAMPALTRRPALFVGDSLFGAGCGRLFEGTGAQLAAALTTLAAQDPRALVCCAHEYTAANLRFAVVACPDVSAVAARLATLPTEMAVTASSLPSTLALELTTNPFLLALHAPDPVARVLDLRRRKDTFAG